MEETKTTLQKIVEQKTRQIEEAIEQAIAEGAKYEKTVAGVVVDGVYLIGQLPNIGMVLSIKATPNIQRLFEPSKEQLRAEAEKKRIELEEIERQIKEKEAENETYHN